jgi:hypothetical protein
MAGPGDSYRLKAAEMLARAEEHTRFRHEFEKLAKAFLRLADQAERNSQLGLSLELDDPAVPQRQQSSDTLQEQPRQQQQQMQRKNKPPE